MAKTQSRKTTNQLLDWAEQGVVDWETLARDCLNYMDEAEVSDMARVGGYFDSEDDEQAYDEDHYDPEEDFILNEYR